MTKISFLVVLLFTFCAVHAQEKQNQPVEIESLKDADCLKAVLKMEGYLYKTSLDDLNAPENFFYGIELKGIEEQYPYLLKDSESGKEIIYERMMPILVEALEESVELLDAEKEKRVKLEEEFANYQITMENHLKQVQYQIDLLRSELSGFYESKSVD